jgi:hypothetical protein
MPIDLDRLDALFATAEQKANADGASLEDINTAAGIAKAASEARKSAAEATNSNAQIRLEILKSVSTFLVPLVSFLTIAFTVWIQYLQSQETRHQDEATQWRDFLSYAKSSATTVQSDPTFSPRLRSFFSSSTYHDQAINISKRLMGEIADSGGFSDLFDVTFAQLDSDNFADVVDVEKLLYANTLKYYSTCAQFMDNLPDKIKQKVPKTTDLAGICSRAVSEKAIRDAGVDADRLKTLAQLRHDTTAFEDENNAVSVKIGDYIRNNYSIGKPHASKVILLNHLYIYGANLSDVDFSSFDVSDTIFDSTILTRAKFTPAKLTTAAGGTPVDLRDTEWWEAREIDQVALEYLVEYEYPYYFKDLQYPGNPHVDKNHYAERVMALCIPLKPFCQRDKLRFSQ